MNNYVIKFNKQKVGDMAKRQTEVGRIQLWKFLTFSRFGNNFKINLLALLGLAPIVYILYAMFSENFAAVANLPFTSFVGVGYPLVTDSLESAFVASQAIFMNYAVFMLPIAVFISMILTIPAQYAARNFVWSEGFFHFNHIFKSFKLNIVNRTFIGVLSALITLFATYMIYLIKNSLFYNGYSFLTILAIIGIAIFCVLAVLVTLYAMSISMTYKSSIVAVYSDAVGLTIKVLVQNLFVLIPVVFPIVLIYGIIAFVPMLLPIAFTAIMFIGVSWIFITWEVYAQYVFGLVESSREKLNKKKSKSR